MKIENRMILCVASVVAIGFFSCKKNFLETKIDTNATPSTIITDRNSLFQFADAMYTALPYGFTALDNNLFAPATDEAFQTQVTASNVRVYNQGTLSPINTGGSDITYSSLYAGIRAANFFLDYSVGYAGFLMLNRDTTSASAFVNYRNDSLSIAWFRGEAHVIRAYYYSELIKRFGGVPLITTTLQQTTPANVNVPRKSYDEMVAYIVSEIDQYKDSVQVNWKTSSFKGNDGRFSKGSAMALKARVLLYAASPLHGSSLAKWQNAAQAAKDVIVTPGLNLSLYTGGYGNMFIGSTPASSSNNEVIFAVRAPASNTPEVNNYPISTPGGKTGVTPSQNLVADYEFIGPSNPDNPYANRDPRLAATVVTNGSTWNGRIIDESTGGTDDMAKANTSKTGFYLKKFLTDNLNLIQNGTAQHNWIIFRYAEVLLNYAEALNEAYGPDGMPSGYPMSARTALKMVRDRASNSLPLVTTASPDDFRTAVKHERRIELAFEDHRYWDLLRWNDAPAVLNLPLLGVRVTRNSNGTFNYAMMTVANRVFKAPSMNYIPFPFTEVAKSNGILIQNPGY